MQRDSTMHQAGFVHSLVGYADTEAPAQARAGKMPENPGSLGISVVGPQIGG